MKSEDPAHPSPCRPIIHHHPGPPEPWYQAGATLSPLLSLLQHHNTVINGGIQLLKANELWWKWLCKIKSTFSALRIWNSLTRVNGKTFMGEVKRAWKLIYIVLYKGGSDPMHEVSIFLKRNHNTVQLFKDLKSDSLDSDFTQWCLFQSLQAISAITFIILL